MNKLFIASSFLIGGLWTLPIVSNIDVRVSLPYPYSVEIQGYFAVTFTLSFGIDLYAETPPALEVCQRPDNTTTFITRDVH
jgi:hypothetical protein